MEKNAPEKNAPDFVDIVELARSGAPAGQKNVQLDADTLLVEVVCRPAVAMPFLTGVPYAAALGVADALSGLGASGVGVAWPHDVCGPDGVMATIRTTAGFGEGMFVVCHVALAGVTAETADVLAEAVAAGIGARVNEWAAGIASAGKAATPLGPVLNELFDRMPLMGQPIEVVYPNGNVAMRGTLAGMDVWGRATVRNELGGELDIAPEQARIRPAAN